jgi:predicted DsbA family dithiol-disulfide isomerase
MLIYRKAVMHIDVYQDIACPWCRIGKRYLSQALEQWQGEPVTVTYHPFFLNDSIPAEGYDFREYMRAKGGGDPNLERWFEAPRRLGEAIGLTFHFEKITHAPNTLLAHQLVEIAPPELRSSVVEALFDAYFEFGENIGDLPTLVQIAGRAGLEAERTEADLKGSTGQAAVSQQVKEAVQMGVSSVPLFVFNKQFAISGARQPAYLLAAMEHSQSAVQAS